jgi:hypothetical protein
MATKVIRLTEQDITNIVRKVINEQTEERDFIKAVQIFLNQKLNLKLVVDGKTGPNSETAKAIERYQQSIGVYPVDGVWGHITWGKMPKEDKKLLKDLIAQQGGLFDRFLNWIGIS